MHARLRITGALAAALALGPALALSAGSAEGAPLRAQADAADRTARRGWIGVNVDVMRPVVAASSSADAVRFLVTDVYANGPAARAGVRRGDLIVRIDGREANARTFESLLGSLRAGRSLRLGLMRAGSPHEVTMTATSRPERIALAEPYEFEFRMDDLKKTFIRSLDSIRFDTWQSGERDTHIELDREPPRGLRVTTSVDPQSEWVLVYRDNETLSGTAGWVSVGESAPYVPRPLGAFVVHSRSVDSLSTALYESRLRLNELRRAENTRMRELADVAGTLRRIDTSDARLTSLRAAAGRAETTVLQLREQLDQASQAVLANRGESRSVGASAVTSQTAAGSGSPRVRPSTGAVGPSPGAAIATGAASTAGTSTGAPSRARSGGVAPSMDPGPRARPMELRIRPITPYLLIGQNYFAGARLIELSEGLARYFEVAGGLLVTEVHEGSPAHDVGLIEGDVIVAVAGTPVGSREDLRGALTGAERPLSVSFVRKGTRTTVTLP